MKKLLLGSALAALYASNSYAHGDEHYKPEINGFGGHGDINLIAASNYKSDFISEEYNEISTHSHADVYYNFNDNTSLNAAVQLAHIHGHHHGDANPTDDKFMQEHGIELKKFYIEHEIGKANLYAARSHQNSRSITTITLSYGHMRQLRNMRLKKNLALELVIS
jgi:hypothetical protein